MLALAIIIIVFIFTFGVDISPQRGGQGEQEDVATVDGTPVSYKEYSDAYQRQLSFFKQQFDGQIPDELLEGLGLKDRALDTLIDRVLVVNAGRSEGIRVATEEIQSKIISLPFFQVDGVYSQEKYIAVLQRNSLVPALFEEGISNDILTEKMRSSILDDVSVTVSDVRDRYLLERRELALNYVKLSAADFSKDVVVTDEDARSYFADMGGDYMLPTTFKAIYGFVSKEDLIANVNVEEEAIKEFYDRNRAKYELPREVKARHILVKAKLTTDDSDGKRQEARERIEDIQKRLANGESFSALAKELSEDPGSGSKGGDLGWFGPGKMVRPFEEAAFALVKGEISDIVVTEYGFHIIKADDVRAASTATIGDKRSEIRRALASRTASVEGRSMMGSLHNTFKNAATVADIEAEAKLKGVKTFTTNTFTMGDMIEVLVQEPKLRDATLMLGQGTVSGIVETENGLYIIKLLERVDEHIPPFEDVEEKVTEAFAKVKSFNMAREAADSLLMEAKTGGTLSSAAADRGYVITKTTYFSMDDGEVPGIGVSTAGEASALFEIKDKGVIYNTPLLSEESFYAVEVNGVKEAGDDGLEEARAGIRQRLLSEKQENVMSAWMDGLREKAEIFINEDML
jgi:peptidyl-prolyl cis-trans isomerase D